MSKPYFKSITPKEALIKAAAYCAYQERCYKEVEERLAEWGIFGTDAGVLMLQLSEQNYLNEERYAKAYAGGKFRTKKWGRNKIKLALKQNNISEHNIKIGLREINADDYENTLRELAVKKLESLQTQPPSISKNRTAQWLISKGYEADLIWNTLNNLI